MNTHNDSSPQSTAATSSAQAYLDIAGVMLGALDIKGTITLMNKKGHELLGYPEGELLGKNWFNTCLPTANREEIAAVFQQQMNGDFPPLEFYENSVLTSTGDERLVTFHNTLLYDGDRLCGVLFSGEDITRRKQAEDKLRESEENLRITLDSIGDAVISTDTDGRIVLFNPVAQKLTGFSLQEAVGRDIYEVFNIVKGGTNEPAENPVKRVLEEGKIVGLANHTVLISKDGSEYQIADSGAPIINSAGEITGAVLVFRDVTETYRQQEVLRKSEERFDLAMMIKNEGTWDWNLVTNQVDFDQRYYTMAGYDPGDFANNLEEFQKRVHPEDVDCVMSTVEQYLAGQIEQFQAEFRFKRKDGSWIWIQGRGQIVERDEKGIPLRFIGTHSDITERKQAEEALTLSNEIFEKLTNSAKDAIIQIDHEGKVAFWNPAATEIFGYDAVETAGINLHQLLAPESLQERHLKAFPGFLKTGKGNAVGETLELEGIHKNGQRVPIELSLSSFELHGNRQAMAVIRDISERKQAEADRLELEAQLRQKYKMEAVGTMAGGIAHNFNNNLSVILGNVELSQLKNNNPEVSQLLKNAKIGIMRSRDLVSQIMSYSRKGTQSVAPLQLPLIIDETLKLLGSTIPTTVQLNQIISPDSNQATINADASQIQEILLNLYGNAVHAMEEKGRLDITLDVVDLANKDLNQPGRYARITIRDSGCGMTAAVQEKIFDPFFTTKEMHEGTGMGLSTVQGIIEQHNGLIKVESSVGQGTTFELYFPVIDQTQAEQPTPVKADIPRGSEKILFVDDDEMLAKLGELQLEELGYQVSTMTKSPEALKLFAANADYFDLVITDQTMPDLSGKELIAELLKIRPDIPTIICTGYSSQVSKEEAEKLGAKAFVMKPLNLQELAQTVRRVLDGEEDR